MSAVFKAIKKNSIKKDFSKEKLFSKYFVYQKAYIRTFHTSIWQQNSLFEFTTLEYTFKCDFILKTGFKHSF